MPRIKSLHQRLLLFVLIPMAILLVVMGVVVFSYAQEKIRAQWSESVKLRLGQIAHNVDMRLDRPKQLLRLYNESSGTPGGAGVRDAVLARLKSMEGVAGVRLARRGASTEEWESSPMAGPRRGRSAGMERRRQGMMHVSLPHYHPEIDGRVITLSSDPDVAAERVEVDIYFDYLIKKLAVGKWRESTAILVAQNGDVLNPKDLGDWPETEDGLALKKSTLEAMRQAPSGTVFGLGNPPRIMSGYHQLEQAPWTLVIFASGEEVLSELLNFRLYYIGVVTGFGFLLLLLVHAVTGRTIVAIKTVSREVEQLARGRFGPPLPVQSEDEVGELTRGFNTMVDQLKDRMRIKKTLNLAMEVQLSLLPQSAPLIEGLDVAGRSIYCDETGGDYFDYIPRGRGDGGKWLLLLGDVSDHGLPSALLMTTARAFLRQRAQQPGGPAEILTDVNRLLADDTTESGLFMTLFCLEIDPVKKNMAWSAAGHDPAIVYDINADAFAELEGRGPALGIMESFGYQTFRGSLDLGRIIVIGTDGIWETRNPRGEHFGKDRLRALIAKNHQKTAQNILAAVIEAVDLFRASNDITDDLTLIVVKVKV
ncbi:MAG: SpoIIE family protein phosphatase [Pseudomonadota bacterium]